MRILKLELKRLLRAKLTWALAAFGLLSSVLLAYLPVTFCYSSVTDETGNEAVLTGLASIAYEKERQAGASGLADPERVRAAVEAYQACLNRYGVTESYDLPEGVYEQEILPIAPLLHGVREAFADPKTGMAPRLIEVDPAQLDDFDAVCETRVASLLEMEQPDFPAAQRKAVELYRRVEKPLAVYPGLNSTALDYQNILAFLVLLICTAIAAPLFSAEYQSGADEILRCTRYGGTWLAVAKIAAALCISGGLFAACSAAYLLTVNSLFGWECVKTSVQMAYSIVTLSALDMGQLQGLFALAGSLSVLASVSLTLFLSAKCRNAATALAAAMAFCIAPVVAAMALPGAASAWLCTVLPASGVSIQASILYAVTDFRFLNVFGFPIWTPCAMIAACIVEIPLFVGLAVRAHKKHAVG